MNGDEVDSDYSHSVTIAGVIVDPEKADIKNIGSDEEIKFLSLELDEGFQDTYAVQLQHLRRKNVFYWERKPRKLAIVL